MSQNMSDTFYALILKFCLEVVCKGYEVLVQVLVLLLVLILVPGTCVGNRSCTSPGTCPTLRLQVLVLNMSALHLWACFCCKRMFVYSNPMFLWNLIINQFWEKLAFFTQLRWPQLIWSRSQNDWMDPSCILPAISIIAISHLQYSPSQKNA